MDLNVEISLRNTHVCQMGPKDPISVMLYEKNWKKIFNPKKKCDFQVALKMFTIQKGTIFKQFWVIFEKIWAKKIFLTKSCGF